MTSTIEYTVRQENFCDWYSVDGFLRSFILLVLVEPNLSEIHWKRTFPSIEEAIDRAETFPYSIATDSESTNFCGSSQPVKEVLSRRV